MSQIEREAAVDPRLAPKRECRCTTASLAGDLSLPQVMPPRNNRGSSFHSNYLVHAAGSSALLAVAYSLLLRDASSILSRIATMCDVDVVTAYVVRVSVERLAAAKPVSYDQIWRMQANLADARDMAPLSTLKAECQLQV
jgi:hypothetical protein